MNKLRLCHSFWTKPMLGKRWNIENQAQMNAWLFSLSVHYAKKLGAEIVLHTDDLGEKILGHLPYDNIYLTLNKHDVSHTFWASGKLVAQAAEPLGSVHIDGDAYVLSVSVRDALLYSDYDLVVQNTEGCGFECGLGAYPQSKTVLEPILNNIDIPGIRCNELYAYNCGLIGFKNEALKKAYLDGYFKMLDAAQSNPDIMKAANADNHLCLDIIMEQWWLKVCADYHHANVKGLLEDEIWRSSGDGLGYSHILGTGKYRLVEDVKRQLLEANPAIYLKTATIIKALCESRNISRAN